MAAVQAEEEEEDNAGEEDEDDEDDEEVSTHACPTKSQSRLNFVFTQYYKFFLALAL